LSRPSRAAAAHDAPNAPPGSSGILRRHASAMRRDSPAQASEGARSARRGRDQTRQRGISTAHVARDSRRRRKTLVQRAAVKRRLVIGNGRETGRPVLHTGRFDAASVRPPPWNSVRWWVPDLLAMMKRRSLRTDERWPHGGRIGRVEHAESRQRPISSKEAVEDFWREAGSPHSNSTTSVNRCARTRRTNACTCGSCDAANSVHRATRGGSRSSAERRKSLLQRSVCRAHNLSAKTVAIEL
jgi:hypothetical protein